MEGAVSSYTARVTEKLRHERLGATVLTVCFTTNEFKEGLQYSNALTMKLAVATDATSELIRLALQEIRTIYRQGYHYKKAGVIFTDMLPASQAQADLFDYQDRGKFKRLMSALEAINNRWGADTLHDASSGIRKAWCRWFSSTLEDLGAEEGEEVVHREIVKHLIGHQAAGVLEKHYLVRSKGWAKKLRKAVDQLADRYETFMSKDGTDKSADS